MPKDNIDYSNTIIYKIYCKDQNISDLYVGHTTNFTKRKCLHKRDYINLNKKLKIYNIIRDNGGWDNWDMVEIAKYNCKDHTEARIKEQQHYEDLKSSSNNCSSLIDDTNKNGLNGQILTNTDNLGPQKLTKYCCEKCNYVTYRKSNYDIHILSPKHKNTDIILTNTDAESSTENTYSSFTCNCGKKYKHRQSLFSHKKKCTSENLTLTNYSEDSMNNEMQELKEFMKYLMKENLDMKSMMMEVIKNGTISNSNNNNINNNSHNKTFNLQFFLNETCKNAMNITDFVDSLNLQISDLEKVGEVGYIEGISSIIIKNLNALDVTERPIHCTDKKRETMYIRDEDKWEKEDEKRNKLHKMVKNVAFKNINLISDFQELHPDWKKINSKYSDQINKIIIESMGGKGDNEYEKEEKIIKRVAKEVFVDKCL